MRGLLWPIPGRIPRSAGKVHGFSSHGRDLVHRYGEPSMGKVDGSVGEEDGFILGRDVPGSTSGIEVTRNGCASGEFHQDTHPLCWRFRPGPYLQRLAQILHGVRISLPVAGFLPMGLLRLPIAPAGCSAIVRLFASRGTPGILADVGRTRRGERSLFGFHWRSVARPLPRRP